jgi:toxin ParE1/3/4
MNPKVSFHELAELELNDAAAFFEIKREGLGLRFLSVVEAAVSHIQEYPEASPIIIQDIRHKVLRRFLTASCTRSNRIGFESLL